MSQLIIPLDQLKPEVLEGIVKDFVLREGTDYGQVEFNLESKIEAVVNQIKKGVAFVTYDSATETCSITSGTNK